MEDVVCCVEIIDATPARWRGDAGSSAASSPRNDFVKNCRVHPTHWLNSTQVDRAGRDVRGLEASCPVDAPDDDDDCFFLGWLFPKPAPPSLELPGRRRNRKPKYAKVATTPSAGGFAIADDSSDSDGDMV